MMPNISGPERRLCNTWTRCDGSPRKRAKWLTRAIVGRWSLVCLGLVSGCGGGSSSTSPTPTPVTPQANRAPVLTSVTVTPTFGIVNFQTFTFAAIATDLDGDVLSYAWNISGATPTGATTSGTFNSPGDGTATMTVSDGRGGTASSSVPFVVGSMAGNWTVTSGPLVGATFSLSQSSTGIVTGSFFLPGIGSGNTDPAQPGTMNANAALSMRVKIGAFTDFTMSGTMAPTGRLVTGTLQGSGFTGQSFAMSK